MGTMGMAWVAGGIAALAAAVALVVRLALLRLAGLKPARRGRRARMTSVIELVARSLPPSAASESAAREAIERSGQAIDPNTLWATRLFSVGAGVVAGSLLAAVWSNPWGWLLVPLLGLVGAMGPTLWLARSGARWRDDIERELPAALDLMGVSVAAGTSFDAAVRIVATRTSGALAESLADVVAAAEFSSMTEALSSFASRAQVEPLSVFVASLEQAQRSGIPVADILRTQAASVRTYRRQSIEEQINMLPTRMIFPQLLIFACILIAILVPTFAQIFSTLF